MTIWKHGKNIIKKPTTSGKFQENKGVCMDKEILG